MGAEKIRPVREGKASVSPTPQNRPLATRTGRTKSWIGRGAKWLQGILCAGDFLSNCLSPAARGAFAVPFVADRQSTLLCLSLAAKLAPAGGSLDSEKGMGIVSGASVVMALLQSLCTAVLTINSIRLGIGLAALASSSIAASVLSFHRDAIRIPMLTLAVAGAVANLLVLAWIWHLRARPESQWRRREISKKQRRSERLQVLMAILTLILVGLELRAHAIVHRGPAPAAVTSSSTP